MPRYIDADILKDLYQPFNGKDYNVNMAIIRANIDDIPTADVQEVKHGKWICPSKNPEYNNKDLFNDCSIFGETYLDEYDFCPNCGAKMGGDKSV